jgi:hypothetical protein
MDKVYFYYDKRGKQRLYVLHIDNSGNRHRYETHITGGRDDVLSAYRKLFYRCYDVRENVFDAVKEANKVFYDLFVQNV